MQTKIANPEYADLIGAVNADVDRVRAVVEAAAADETMRNFAIVSVAAATAAALVANILPSSAVPVSAIVVLSMAGPMYLAQHVNLVDRNRLTRRDSPIEK